MYSFILSTTIALSILVFISCNTGHPNLEFEEWKEARLTNVKSAYGWPSVIGLYPITDSITTLGSDESNSIVFPESA